MKTKKMPATPLEAASPALPPLTMPRFSSWWRLFIYPACILIPGGGFALGLLYALQDDRSAKIFGRICLGLAILGALARLSQGGHYDGFQASDSLTRPFY